ncbi:MAG: protein kinase [Lachnospiraceae bacterium]|nr:protein kinase [Lachnospiraceae bacterium]
MFRIKMIDARGNDRGLFIQTGLDHPGIPRIYLLKTHGLIKMAVVEYFPGMTLGENVRKGLIFRDCETVDGMSRRITQIMSELCGILDYIHSKNLRSPVLHLDIHPDNLIWHRGRLRLIDFGNARYGYEGAERTVPRVCRGFAAPELYEGGDICEASDIYSAGRVMLYLLGCAAAYFDWEGDMRCEMLLDVALECVRRDVRKRPQSAAELMYRIREGRRAEKAGLGNTAG